MQDLHPEVAKAAPGVIGALMLTACNPISPRKIAPARIVPRRRRDRTSAFAISLSLAL